MHAASIRAYRLVYRVLAISQPLEISYNACQSPRPVICLGQSPSQRDKTVDDYARILKASIIQSLRCSIFNAKITAVG